jgi:hypothetical protein
LKNTGLLFEIVDLARQDAVDGGRIDGYDAGIEPCLERTYQVPPGLEGD